MQVQVKDTKLLVKNGNYTVEKDGYVWCSDEHFVAQIILNNDRCIAFEQAKDIRSEYYEDGCGKGILTRYRDLKGVNFAFDTLVWIEESTQDIFFEWIIVNDHGFDIKEVKWPNSFAFHQKDGYSLIPYMQGILLPNTWDYDYEKLAFNGQFCSSAAYMPWFAQIENEHGYIMINTTPWDARYVVEHSASTHETKLSVRWLPSLAKMAYKRVLRYRFLKDCDHNTMCKVYREYAKETGLFTSLKEKKEKNAAVDQLVGRSFVHTKIKTHFDKQSHFYDANNPSQNDQLISFEDKIKQLETMKQAGAKALYVHLDGWGNAGYDNEHPDVLPPNQEAGGYAGLKKLVEALHHHGDLIGLHDQYRDYYHQAKSYRRFHALQDVDGGYYEFSHWAGGVQNYLCATLAKRYVKRNYERLLVENICIDASYLDVFTCNELDECSNPTHRMTRKECASARNECFAYLHSKHILPSSEECSDFAMKQLVFAHYGPYEFMLKEKDSKRMGIAVPLFNLVYHDCMILPWPMKKGKEDYMLYALLNGGVAYLIREGAYPNVDGVFKSDPLHLQEKIERCQIVSDLHRKVAYEEMIAHHFLSADYSKQESIFSDGTHVIIDLKTNQYTIK
ncbi:MAG: hypothetical protein EOM50_02825 [Erysipelotrichia bacterium]|nr:hypothetical protein [Erysipelotrichia bacterium]NCC54019.1 hypothetical protein [Erysipelotrichia bacterium]